MGTMSGAAGKLIGNRGARQRLLGAALAAGHTTFKSIARVLHMLFLEVTGFLFFVIAVIGAGALVREYQAYEAGRIGPGKVGLAALFTVMFAWFGVSSIWKARRRKS